MKKYTIDFTRINRFLIKAIVFMLFVYVLVQIAATSIGNTYQDIANIRAKKDALRRENEILISQIEQAKSTISAQDVIEKYGLVQKQVNFIDNSNLNNNIQANR